jgi:nucleoside-diphosphate-sugar epimerase
MKFVVTGGLGFIGHEVTRQLCLQGHECVVVDNSMPLCTRDSSHEQYLQTLRRQELTAVIEACDIRNTADIHTCMRQHAPDVVIHLASFPNQRAVECDPVLACDVMTLGLINVLEAAVTAKVTRFVYVSSSMVYGNFPAGVIESHACEPLGSYAIHKYMGEHLVSDYQRRHDINTVVVRPSAVYGSHDHMDRVIGVFIRQALRDEIITVRGPEDGLDFTHVTDCAAGIVLAATVAHAKGIYNIAKSDRPTWTKAQAAAYIRSLAGQGHIMHSPRDNSYPIRNCLNIQRARTELGYDPQMEFLAGVKQTYEWYSQHPLLWH